MPRYARDQGLGRLRAPGTGRSDPLGERIWLEKADQQRLRRLQRRLEVRRQFIERWAKTIDDLEERIHERLNEAESAHGRRQVRHTSESRAHVVADDEFDDEFDEAAHVEKKPAIETYLEDGERRSRRWGSSRPFSVGGTKQSQVATGRATAREDITEHIIKNGDARVAERSSYGPSPLPREG